MQDKKYIVVTLPKEDQGQFIDIDKKEVFEDFEDAALLLENLYTMATSKPLPKLKRGQAVTLETPTSYLQIWVCEMTLMNDPNDIYDND